MRPIIPYIDKEVSARTERVVGRGGGEGEKEGEEEEGEEGRVEGGKRGRRVEVGVRLRRCWEERRRERRGAEREGVVLFWKV